MPQDSVTFQQQFPQLFQQGLAYQKLKNWDDAIGKYKTLLDEGQNFLTDQQVSVIYHNMASCSFEKSDFIKSYIWSRKSVALDSNSDAAQQLLVQVTKKFQPPQIPHQISAVESLQKVALKNVSPDILLISFFIFFSLTVALGCRFWLVRKRNQIESESASVNKKNPLGPLLTFIGVSITTLILASSAFLKWSDSQVPKAIIAEDKTAVQTASGGNQAVIYDAGVGLEVDVLRIESNFVQIRYPGAFSGWVDKKNLEILSQPYWP